MTAHEQPISYLDSILNEEESRCEYSHQWRNFTISRSGRFKSKNRKRDAVDGKLFDASSNSSNMISASGKSSSSTKSPASKPSSSQSSMSSSAMGHSRVMASPTMNPHYKHQEPDKNTYRQPSAMSSKLYSPQSMSTASANSRNMMMREKTETYKSYYETNL